MRLALYNGSTLVARGANVPLRDLRAALADAEGRAPAGRGILHGRRLEAVEFRRVGVAHWDDVDAAPPRERARWTRPGSMLGDAAGARDVGLNRVRVAPGKLPTPPHSHGASEEIFYVLGGSGLAWQDDAVHEMRAGRLRHPPRRPLRAHVHRRRGRPRLPRLRHAPSDRDRLAAALARDPDRLAVGGGARRRSVGRRGEAAAARLRRPGAAPGEHRRHRRGRARARGATRASPRRSRRASAPTSPGSTGSGSTPGKRGAVPHCHSEEEEIFVILEGAATLELWPSPLRAERGAVAEQVELRPGHVVARPAGIRHRALVPRRRRTA